MMLIRGLCIMHFQRVFTLKSTPLPPTFTWALHPSSISVLLLSLSLSLPSSLCLFLYDNESIVCAIHSQLSKTQMRGEVDHLRSSDTLLFWWIVTSYSCSPSFSTTLTAMHHPLKMFESPPPSTFQYNIHNKKTEKNEVVRINKL